MDERAYTSDDVTLYNHRRQNLKSYMLWETLAKVWEEFTET
jgi:hypothetical protein